MRADFERVTPKTLIGNRDFHYIRELRDPLYGYIHLTRIENKLIDTNEFQRLDRLYQTPTAHFVYPNATHTRKSHSLGVMHLAHKSLFSILYRQCSDIRKIVHPLLSLPCTFIDNDNLDELDEPEIDVWWDGKSYLEILQVIRISGLLHDIGHGPFSHIFESVSTRLNEEGKCEPFKHENMSSRIISEKLSDKFSAPISCDDVVNLISKDYTPPKNISFLKSLLDSPYDVDKLDYLCRDAYHSGTHEYGKIDYERILDGFIVKDGSLLISESSLGCIMNSFTAAQYMYSNIYFHKTSRTFDFMIYDALSMVPSFVNELIENLDLFLSIDDHNIISEIKNRRDKSDEENKYTESYELLMDVLNRKKKYKTIYEKMLTLSIVSVQEEGLTEIRRSLEAEFVDINAKIDITTQVRPIRVNPLRIQKWLTNPVILTNDGTAKPLEEISWAYYSSLTKLQVIFRVLVNRSIYDDTPDHPRITRLREAAIAEVTEIEKKESIARA